MQKTVSDHPSSGLVSPVPWKLTSIDTFGIHSINNKVEEATPNFTTSQRNVISNQSENMKATLPQNINYMVSDYRDSHLQDQLNDP